MLIRMLERDLSPICGTQLFEEARFCLVRGVLPERFWYDLEKKSIYFRGSLASKAR